MRQNYSSRRKAILNKIVSTNVHPSVSWIYENLKKDYPSLSLGTVYRNVNKFKDEGIVKYVATVDGEEHIDGNTKPHAHIVCEKCKSIIDISDVELQPLINAMRSRGFCVNGVGLTFYGVCPQCCQND